MAPRKWGYLPLGAERSCKGPPALPWSARGLPERAAENGRLYPDTIPLTGVKLPGGGGGSYPSSVSTSLPASSACRLLTPFKLSAMARPNLQMRAWSLAGSRRAETLLLTSLHVASEIHAFFLASCAWGFRTALHRNANIPSSLIGVVSGRRGGCLLPPR